MKKLDPKALCTGEIYISRVNGTPNSIIQKVGDDLKSWASPLDIRMFEGGYYDSPEVVIGDIAAMVIIGKPTLHTERDLLTGEAKVVKYHILGKGTWNEFLYANDHISQDNILFYDPEHEKYVQSPAVDITDWDPEDWANYMASSWNEPALKTLEELIHWGDPVESDESNDWLYFRLR